MKVLLFVFFVSLSIFGEEIYFKINEDSGAVTLTTSKKTEGLYLSQKEWNLHRAYSKEMFLPQYATMSDEEMNKKISKKLKTSPKKLKEIYTKGLVVEEALKKLNIK